MSSIKLTTSFSETLTTTVEIVGFSITSAIVIPFTQARLFIVLEDITGALYPRLITLTGEDYLGWGADDTFLNTYVSANIESIYKST